MLPFLAGSRVVTQFGDGVVNSFCVNESALQASMIRSGDIELAVEAFRWDRGARAKMKVDGIRS